MVCCGEGHSATSSEAIAMALDELDVLQKQNEKLQKAILDMPNHFEFEHPSSCDFGYYDKTCTCGLKHRVGSYLEQTLYVHEDDSE
jgi:hypothetical protein